MCSCTETIGFSGNTPPDTALRSQRFSRFFLRRKNRSVTNPRFFVLFPTPLTFIINRECACVLSLVDTNTPFLVSVRSLYASASRTRGIYQPTCALIVRSFSRTCGFYGPGPTSVSRFSLDRHLCSLQMLQPLIMNSLNMAPGSCDGPNSIAIVEMQTAAAWP